MGATFLERLQLLEDKYQEGTRVLWVSPPPLPTPFYSQLGWCARVTLPMPALAPVMNTDTVISHTVT